MFSWNSLAFPMIQLCICEFTSVSQIGSLCHSLNSICKWHMVSVFLWLTSLSTIIPRSIYVAANGNNSSFFDDPVVFHCEYIHHILSIHSSLSGHFGCFHDLATVNSAAVNRRAQGPLQIVVLSREMNWFDLDISHVLDHMCLYHVSFFIEVMSCCNFTSYFSWILLKDTALRQ